MKIKKQTLIKIIQEELSKVILEKDDRCTRIAKSKYDVWPSAYASGAIAKCRKVGAANYGTGGKKKKKTRKAAQGGLMEAIKKVDREQSIKAKEGKVVRMTKRKSKNPRIARGCGAIMASKRKVTKRA